ncbi:hypothetical protein ABEV34_28720 [Methylorubrum rhodesianum]|uniref:hypothetical protein n=1 Tax=Methylorubrum rhodesianum TaxID=29427 RepID=UPI003D2E31EB
MSRPDHATLEAAVADAREALARPPAERRRRLSMFAAYASRLVIVTRQRPGEHPLAAEGRELRARLLEAFEQDLDAQRTEHAAAIEGHRRRNAAWLRGGG